MQICMKKDKCRPVSISVVMTPDYFELCKPCIIVATYIVYIITGALVHVALYILSSKSSIFKGRIV